VSSRFRRRERPARLGQPAGTHAQLSPRCGRGRDLLSYRALRVQTNAAQLPLAADVGHGPFERITLFGATIGRLKFQPPEHDRQCSLTSFFEDDPARFVEWFESLDKVERHRHQFQIDQYARLRGKFDLPPVYDFEGQVLDGGHRTRAAYFAYLRSADSDVALEIICDVAAVPR
jgi:hypothetical protein